MAIVFVTDNKLVVGCEQGEIGVEVSLAAHDDAFDAQRVVVHLGADDGVGQAAAGERHHAFPSLIWGPLGQAGGYCVSRPFACDIGTTLSPSLRARSARIGSDQLLQLREE
jgi:hypothetical protein